MHFSRYNDHSFRVVYKYFALRLTIFHCAKIRTVFFWETTTDICSIIHFVKLKTLEMPLPMSFSNMEYLTNNYFSMD